MTRPKLRTQENGDHICRLLAEGHSLRQIAKALQIKSAGSITDWVRDDAEFSVRYARATELRHERWAEEILEIADNGSNDWMEREGLTVPDHENVQRSRLRVDSRKWLLSKLAPRRFGDKITAELVGNASAPIVNRIELVAVDPRLPGLEELHAQADDEAMVKPLWALPSR